MGTGDQAGTWGATTNNNFQYIFEQAIAGVQTVSVTATPQALTYLNGATATLANNQAIAAALILTNGGVNANFTITTPSGSQKLYIIYNNTSYIATIQVTGSSGSTVAIPTQTTTTVYTDGTNFYVANTGTVGAYGVNGVLTVTGNASIGGTLAVTGATTLTGAAALNGGGTSTTPTLGDNSTKIATTAFVQSALPSSGAPLSAASGGTGEAGTLTGVLYGNGTSAFTQATAAQLVSAIGSTFVTNATNATNATSLTSTLAVANGGTGSTTVAGILTTLGFAGQAYGSNPGYYKFPNGLIVQWGNQLSWSGYSFAIPFPNAILAAVGTRYSGNGSIGEFGITYNTSAIYPGTNGNTGAWSFIALGY
jgi:hypothetical protein